MFYLLALQETLNSKPWERCKADAASNMSPLARKPQVFYRVSNRVIYALNRSFFGGVRGEGNIYFPTVPTVNVKPQSPATVNA